MNIDPVIASIKAAKNGNSDNHTLKNTCYNVCAAFQGADSSWNVDPKCSEQCNKIGHCSDGKYVMTCNNLDNARPVIWDQTTHYFPDIYTKTHNVSNALNLCNAKCDKTHLPNQCKQNCKIDSYAIVNTIENYKRYSTKRKVPSYFHNKHCDCNKCSNCYKIFFILLLICIIIFLTIKVLLKKNIYDNK